MREDENMGARISARIIEDVPNEGKLDVTEKVQKALEALTSKEALIVKLRFGIGGLSDEPQSLTGVAAAMNSSVSDVRSDEAEALRRLMYSRVA